MIRASHSKLSFIDYNGCMKSSETTPNFYTATLSTPEERTAYKDEVWKLIEKTYKGYGNSGDGNLYGANMDYLVDDVGEWRLAFQGNKVIAGVIYRKFKGSKVRLVLHNDTPAAKATMIDILVKSMTDGGWAEASGNLERVLRDNKAREIPNMEASAILDRPIEHLDPDGVHYWREVFPGTSKREMLFGHPVV